MRHVLLTFALALLAYACEAQCTINSYCTTQPGNYNTTAWGGSTTYSSKSVDTATTAWQTVTLAPGVRWRLTLPSTRINKIMEVTACGGDNIALGVVTGYDGWYAFNQDLNNYSCGGYSDTTGEKALFWIYGATPPSANYNTYVYISAHDTAILSDSVTVKYRIVYNTPYPNANTGYNADSSWFGAVYKGLASPSSNYDYMGAYGTEAPVFTHNFGTGQPGGYSAYMCPDSACNGGNDTFQIVYTKNVDLPQTYVYATSNYTAASNYLALPYPGPVVLSNSTNATFLYYPSYGNQWTLWFTKTTGSLVTDINICQMAGNYTYGHGAFNAYVYSNGGGSVPSIPTDAYYQGTFTSDSISFGYESWGSGPPTMTGNRCGKATPSGNNYGIQFLGLDQNSLGSYKFRIRGGGVLSSFLYLPWGGSTWTTVESNVTLGDVTTSLINFTKDTTYLNLVFYKTTGTGALSFNLAQQPKNPGNMHATNDTVCFGNSTTLSVDTVSGTETQWYKNSCAGSGIYVGSGTTITVTPDSSTTYYARNHTHHVAPNDTVNVLDLYTTTCASLRIVVNPNPSAPSAPSPQTVCSSSSHTFTFSSVTAGSGGNELEWSTNSSFSGSTVASSPANISVTVSVGVIDTIYIRSKVSATGCVSTAVTTTATNNTSPTATASNGGPYCSYGTISLTGGANGLSSYSWSGPNSFSSSSQNPTRSASGNGGTYTITVTGSNGCSVSASTSVSVNTAPTATASNTGPYCSYSTISLVGGPNSMSSYNWTGPNSFSSASQSPNRPANGNSGNYSLTVTDVNGCTGMASTNVITNTAPLANAGYDIFICDGSSSIIGGTPATMGGHAPYTYIWNPSIYLNDSIVANPTTHTNSSRHYVLKVTDSVGCVATDTMLVTVWPLPVAQAGNDTSVCLGFGVVLGNSIVASGGDGFYYYRWSYPQYLNNANLPNPLAIPTNTTAFAVTVTDGNGCIAMDTQNVIIRSSPVANAGNDTTICGGASATLGGSSTSGYAYLWSNAVSLNSATIPNPVAAPTSTTTFVLKVTDASGCINTGNVSVSLYPIIESPEPIFTYAPSIACKRATVCYQAEANNSNRILYSLISGSASIDSNTGCVSNILSNFTIRARAYYPCFSASTDLDVTMSPIISTSPVDTTIWVGDTVTIQGLGGYAYHWITPVNYTATTITVSPGIGSTSYMVRVADSYGCSDTTFAVVNATDTLLLSIHAQHDTIYMFDSTRITVLPNLPNTSISWTRDKLDTITGPSSGTGEIIDALFANTLGVSQNVCFSITGINNGHSTSGNKKMDLGGLLPGVISASSIPASVSACLDTLIHNDTLNNCNLINGGSGFILIDSFPFGTQIISTGNSCSAGNPTISNSSYTTDVVWTIPGDAGCPCILRDTFILGCQQAGNVIAIGTAPPNIATITNASGLRIVYPTLDITSPSPDITYALIGQTALTRIWQICSTDGKFDNLTLVYTPESEIQNVYLNISNGSHHLNTILLSGAASDTINILPADMQTLFPIGYMDSGQCITIKDSFDIKECTDTPSVTFLQVIFHCGAEVDTCLSSNLTQSANVIVSDDYDNIYNVDNSPISFDSLEILQNNEDVTQSGAIPCSNDTITLKYTFTNPWRSNSVLPPNANYKKLENFITYINSCLLNGPTTVSITICDSANNCVTTTPIDTDTNGILNIDLQGLQMNENSTLIISVGGLTFNSDCSYLNSCSTNFTSYIIGGNNGASISYSTMCGHNETINTYSAASYFNNINEDIDDGNVAQLPPSDAVVGDTNTLNFCIEQFLGSGDPWSFSNGPNSFLKCTSLTYQIVLTIPTKPGFTISSISYTPTNSSPITIPSDDILSIGNGVYRIVSPAIQNSGCLNVNVFFSGDSCNSQGGHTVFTAQLYAVCGTGDCGADSIGYCMGTFADSLSYHCHGFCDSTGIGTDTGVIVQRIPIPMEYIGPGSPNLTRAYPWDTIEVIASGEGFSSAGYAGNDVFMHLTYGAPLGSSSLLFKPVSATFSVDSGIGFNSWQLVDTIVGPYMDGAMGIAIDVHLPGGCNAPSQSISNYIIDSSRRFKINLLLQVADDIPANINSGVTDVQLEADMSFRACGDTTTHYSCDPYSGGIELIQHVYTEQAYFLSPTDITYQPETVDLCTQRLLILTAASGGLPQSDEMPNEIRPLIVWPDSADALTVTGLGTNMQMIGAFFNEYLATTSPPFSICSNTATPPCFSQTAGTATIYGDSSGKGWPQFGKNGPHQTYLMDLVVDFDKETCPNDSTVVNVNLNYWSRGMSDTVLTPAQYFSQAGGRAPVAATTYQTDDNLVQLLTWDSIYDAYINYATYVPQVDSFSFNSILSYRGAANAAYAWIYPILPPQVLSLKLDNNSLFDSAYSSSGILYAAVGRDSLSFNVVIRSDSNDCTPGIYSVTFYSGYTCNPVMPPTNDDPNTTSPPNIDSLYTCGFEQSIVQFNIVEPEINTNNSIVQPGNDVSYCEPVTLSLNINASGNAIYSPNCQIAVPVLSYLSGVYYTLTCEGSVSRYPDTGSIPVNINAYSRVITYNCDTGITNFLSLDSLPYLPLGCTLTVNAIFSVNYDSAGSGPFPSEGPEYPYFYADGKNRCGHNLPEVAVKGTIYYTNPIYLQKLESTNCGLSASIIAMLSGSGTFPPFTYSWSNGTIIDTTYNLTETLPISESNIYDLTITDRYGCTYTFDPDTVVLDAPIIASFAITDASCHGDSNGAINLTPGGGSPGYTFLWTGGDTTQNRFNLIAGTYNVKITDSLQCSADTFAIVTQPGVLKDSVVSSSNVTCYHGNNGKITLTVTGGTYPYTYTWTNTGETDSTIINLAANTYSVTVKDANLCSATVSAIIVQPDTVSATVTVSNVSCYDGANGSITLSDTMGGNGGYKFNWSNGDTTITIIGLDTGTYVVTITDQNGCHGIDTGKVTQPIALSISFVTVNDSCNGVNDGSIITTVSNGTPGYTFLWNGSETSQNRTGLPPGIYTVTATDAHGCTISRSDTITQPTTLTFSHTVTDINRDANPATLGVIDITPSGGDGTYNYAWNVAALNGNNPDTLYPGTYIVTITDTKGCSATGTYTIGADVPAEFCFGDKNPENPNQVYTYQGYDVDLTAYGIPSLPAGTTITFFNDPDFYSESEPTYVILGADHVTLNQLNLVFQPDIPLIVAAGQELDIQGSHLYGCSEMWTGIQTEDGGATLNISNSSNGKPSTIEDAFTAVDIEGQVDFIFDSVNFKNDQRCIYLGCTELNEDSSKILNCSFYSTGLKYPNAGFHTFEGIELENSNSYTLNAFNIGYDPKLNPSGKPNYFYNIQNAIFAPSYVVNIYQNYFTDIHRYENYSYNSGTAIYCYDFSYSLQPVLIKTSGGPRTIDDGSSANFVRCDTAILLLGMNARVQDNRMDTVANGVISTLCHTLTLDSNAFQATNYGISLFLNYNASNQSIHDNQIVVNDPITEWVIHRGSLEFTYSPLDINSYGISHQEISNAVPLNCSIFNNTIWGGRNCIWLNNTNGDSVSNNTLHQNSTTSIDGQQAGIQASNCQALTIEENTIDGNSDTYDGSVFSSSSAYRKSGIWLSNVGNSNIACNTLGGSTNGTGVGYGMLLNGDCHGTQIFINDFLASQYGISLSAAGGLSVSYQGGPLGHGKYNLHQNQFIGIPESSGGTTYYTFNNNDVPYGNRTYTYSNSAFNAPPLFYFSGEQNASNDSSTSPSGAYPFGNDAVQPGVVPDGDTVVYRYCPRKIRGGAHVEVNQHEIELVSDSGSYLMEPGYQSNGPWFERKMLYEDLQNDTATLNNDSLMLAFSIANSDSDFGVIYRYQNSLTLTLDTNLFQLDSFFKLSALFGAPDTFLYSYYWFDTSTFAILLSASSAILDSVPQSNSQAVYYQAVSNIYLQRMSTGVDTFTADQLITLTNLAVQCPYTAGDGVYIARSLLASVDNSYFYDDIKLCPPPDSSLRSAKVINKDLTKAEFVKLYPNPTNDVLNLIYYADFNGTPEFEMLNSLGEVVKTQQLNPALNITQFNVVNLSSGVYYWRLSDTDRTVQSGKVAIIHP